MGSAAAQEAQPDLAPGTEQQASQDRLGDLVHAEYLEQVPPVPSASEVEGSSTEIDQPTNPFDECGDGQPRGFWWDTGAQWLMAIIAFFGVAISAWAVWLLKETLIATRKTLDAANQANEEARRAADAGHDANRPWVEVTFPVGVHLDVETELGAHIWLIAHLTNHGNSPATNAFTAATLVPVPTGYHSQRNPIRPIIDAKLDELDALNPPFGVTIFPKGSEGQEVDADFNGASLSAVLGDDAASSIDWLLAVGVTYRFGMRRCRSVTVCRLALDPGEINYSLNSAKQSFKLGDDKLEPTIDGYAT